MEAMFRISSTPSPIPSFGSFVVKNSRFWLKGREPIRKLSAISHDGPVPCNSANLVCFSYSSFPFVYSSSVTLLYHKTCFFFKSLENLGLFFG
uniref:Uncharacterized protein n=1 Tax=Nelumbo nucifera TaxID=4432 RepID=A0A822Z377_NELNU|nr:TPA_asm: hypothetical protein HUJ06_013285 [Nelumbo nucifera]